MIHHHKSFVLTSNEKGGENDCWYFRIRENGPRGE